MPHATSRSAVLARPLLVMPFPLRAFVTSTFLLAAILLGAVPATAMVTEEPKFDIVSKEGDYELQQFAPMMVAGTFVDGNKDDASSRGFKAIAGYIFWRSKNCRVVRLNRRARNDRHWCGAARSLRPAVDAAVHASQRDLD